MRTALTTRLDRLVRLARTTEPPRPRCPECSPPPGAEHRVVMRLDDDAPPDDRERRIAPGSWQPQERCSTCGEWRDVHEITLDLTD